MFRNKKLEAFHDFYEAGEGKRILALAEIFLDEIFNRIRIKKLSNLLERYQFKTTDYVFILDYYDRLKGVIWFTVRDVHTEEQLILMKLLTGELKLEYPWSSAFFLYSGQWHRAFITKQPLFAQVIDKLKRISSIPTIDIEIPPERLADIHAMDTNNLRDIVKEARTLVQDKRKCFTKERFPMLAHTIKTLQQTVPLLETQNREAIELKKMIKNDLIGILEEFLGLPDEKRATQEGKLLEYMHSFYCKALDVQETTS